MKYYLGYYDNTELKPIELEKTKTTILSVVKFTTNFDNLNSLKQHLFCENKIPNSKVSLCYLIEKGKKGHKYYEALKSDKIYTMEYSSLFTSEGLKKFINENKYNEEMIVCLFGEYLRKYGILDTIAEYLRKKDINQLVLILNGLSKTISSLLSSKIKYLIANYQTLSNEEIVSYLDYIIDCFKYNNADLINAYAYFIKSINFKNIPTIKYLHNWYKIAHDYNQTSSEWHNNVPNKYRDIDIEINAFLNSIIYDYDSKKREYKKVGEKRKIQERQLFDLGTILDDYYKRIYDEYLNSIYPDNDSYDEDAEFLCPDDFERMGTTSEEAGIKIRKIYR